jgi:hypothetical protein
MSTPVNIKLTSGTWLTIKSTAPTHLKKFIGPFVVLKRLNRQMFLRGQQDIQVSVVLTLKHFDIAPSLKISE